MKKTNVLMSVLLVCSFVTASFAQTHPTYFDENGAYFGPDYEETEPNYNGAYYTGIYTSPFKTVLGKTDEEIQDKLDQLWDHYFKGDDNSKVYYDKGSEAYIMDIANHDVRSEGMAYGMMICVQTNHKEEFDKLWNWAKNHMWHKDGDWDGYFAWQRNESGTGGDDNCVPDAEMYFMMSLMFAANRWGDDQYREDALYIMDKMWNNLGHKLFNQGNYIIVFQPMGSCKDFSDPSYDLPAYVDLLSRWAEKDTEKWKKSVTATRDHLYKSSHYKTGLFTDYSNFDGTPHPESYNDKAEYYMYDAMRCAMNYGMDYYLFGADATRQEEMAKHIIDFFEEDGYTHARFTWNGTIYGSDKYTQGEAGANAVACFALLGNSKYDEAVKKNMQMAWDAKPMTGRHRYYDGIVHYMAMLHLCGSFKIWKPKPTVYEKNITADEYNGVKYSEKTTFYSFEDGRLYKVTITPKSNTEPKPAPNPDSKSDPENPSTPVSSISDTPSVKVWSSNHTIFISAAPDSQYKIIDLQGRTIATSTTKSSLEQIPFSKSGVFVVIINGKSFKLAL
ncbi:MAG: hypothetical protein J6Y24_09855 [Bacteroidales bacterium]|nr:hypothetical protein [Bacteroidales bacterium]